MLFQNLALRSMMMGAASILAVSLSIPVVPAQAADSPIINVTVKGSVPDVLSRLKKTVAANDMMVMGELHQGKVLSMTGLAVQSETVFVGSPMVGKQLFSAEPGAGVVVPVRINVHEDGQGRTVVSYAKPSALLGTFGNPKVDTVAGMLDTKLHNLVQMLAK